MIIANFIEVIELAGRVRVPFWLWIILVIITGGIALINLFDD